MDFEFVINSGGVADSDHLALRLCRILPRAGGRLRSIFFHHASASALLGSGCRAAWREAAGEDTRLLICSAAWQRAGGQEAGPGWQIAGWPAWLDSREPRARLINFGERCE